MSIYKYIYFRYYNEITFLFVSIHYTQKNKFEIACFRRLINIFKYVVMTKVINSVTKDSFDRNSRLVRFRFECHSELIEDQFHSI